jgi:hypothetical protein
MLYGVCNAGSTVCVAGKSAGSLQQQQAELEWERVNTIRMKAMQVHQPTRNIQHPTCNICVDAMRMTAMEAKLLCAVLLVACCMCCIVQEKELQPKLGIQPRSSFLISYEEALHCFLTRDMTAEKKLIQVCTHATRNHTYQLSPPARPLAWARASGSHSAYSQYRVLHGGWVRQVEVPADGLSSKLRMLKPAPKLPAALLPVNPTRCPAPGASGAADACSCICSVSHASTHVVCGTLHAADGMSLPR